MNENQDLPKITALPENAVQRGKERRRHQRFAINIEIHWEGRADSLDGSICDISEEGCFVLSSGEVQKGEKIKLYIPLVSGRYIVLTGEVVNFESEIGFALHFSELEGVQRQFLERLIDKLKTRK